MKKPNTRSMIFTLYGDYIHRYGGEIWIGSLIELLEAFDHNEQSVRAAISRMSKQDWLTSRKEGNKSYYSLTQQGAKRMDEAASRIYQIEPKKWDGKWRMFQYVIPEEKRSIRDELRKELTWSGFGPLFNSVWVSPSDLIKEAHDIIDKYDIKEYVHLFVAENSGPKSNEEIIRECWDIDYINERYEVFINKYKAIYEEDKEKIEAGEFDIKECFVKQTRLLHYYRKSLFIDPGLPQELLPNKWLGEEAAILFDDYYKVLTEPANVFFKEVYAKGYENYKLSTIQTIK